MIRIGKLRASPIFFAVIGFFAIVDGSRFMLYTLLSAMLHELGHLAALRLCGAPVEEVVLRPFGINIVMGGGRMIGYRQEIAVALAGPLCSAVLAAAPYLWCVLVRPFEDALFLSAINAALTLLNLLPIGDLDGGRARRYALLLTLSPDTAEGAFDLVTLLLLVPLSVGAVWLLITTRYNFSLVVVCAYLLARLVRRRSGSPAAL